MRILGGGSSYVPLKDSDAVSEPPRSSEVPENNTANSGTTGNANGTDNSSVINN